MLPVIYYISTEEWLFEKLLPAANHGFILPPVEKKTKEFRKLTYLNQLDLATRGDTGLRW